MDENNLLLWAFYKAPEWEEKERRIVVLVGIKPGFSNFAAKYVKPYQLP